MSDTEFGQGVMPMDEDERAQALRLIEALLFASAAPIDEAAVAERLPTGTDVAGLLAELEESYRGRGVNILRVAGGWTCVPRRISRPACVSKKW